MPRNSHISSGGSQRDEHSASESKNRLRLEDGLSRLLASIASLLVSRGFSYTDFSKIARAAFVESAVALSKGQGRKASVAQVAASTGLSRVQVASILRRRNPSAEFLNGSRAASVASGWLRDAMYLDKKGSPKVLAFKGGPRSFSSLVKKYSGDIPARAMVREMIRLGMVSCDKNDVVRLVRRRARVGHDSVQALRAVAPLVDILRESALASQSQNVRLSAGVNSIDLVFDSVPQAIAVLGDLKKRRAAFVESISELGAALPQRKKEISMKVTIALTIAMLRNAKKGKNLE